MPITESDIEKIAQLAHLDVTDDERKMFAPQISEIVTYVEQLNAIDTSTVEPALGGLTPEGERTESSRADEVHRRRRHPTRLSYGLDVAHHSRRSCGPFCRCDTAAGIEREVRRTQAAGAACVSSMALRVHYRRNRICLALPNISGSVAATYFNGPASNLLK